MRILTFLILSFCLSIVSYAQQDVKILMNDSSCIVLKSADIDSITFLSDKEKVINGCVFVDLGLPSGLYWATCNVGATKETEIGEYYAWGEIQTRDYFQEGGSELYGAYHPELLSDKEDVAHVRLGEGARIPTIENFRELFSKCKWTWRTNYKRSSMSGYLVTGPNKKTIFLPAGGDVISNTRYYYKEKGFYWTSTPNQANNNNAWGLYMLNGDFDVGNGYERYTGFTIRPVAD